MADTPPTHTLSKRQRDILEFIADQMRERGFPPSVREIGEAVGLTSPSTVHSHLATLQKHGFLRRDPDKPRAIEVRYDPRSGAVADKATVCHVPLVGDVAAGTDVLAQSNVEELVPLPADLTGEGELFMLRVRGESMIDAMINEGDIVVMKPEREWSNGDMVAVWLKDREETTLKHIYRDGPRVRLQPANPMMEPILVDNPEQLEVQGKVMLVLRQMN